MKYVLLLLLLTGCGGAVIVEEWPEQQNYTPPQPKEFEKLEPEPVEEKNFSLVQGQPITFLLNDQNHSIELLAVEEGRARMRVNDVSFRLSPNQTVIRSGIQLEITELAEDFVPMPRPSTVDISVGGSRQRLQPGETIIVENGTAAIDFIGQTEGVPRVRVMVGTQAVILEEKGEHRFNEFWVYVNGIEFNDASEYDFADAATISVRN